MLFPLLLAVAGTCSPEQAHYVLRDDPAITARFLEVPATSDWPSGLALRLHSSRSGRDHDFLPWRGGSAGRLHLASTSDVTAAHWQAPGPDQLRPLGDVEYIGVDQDYNLLADLPQRGAVAPVHFLLPDLREALWYRSAEGQREATARQFFDRARCGG